ncbi:Uma2 family endonuclease [Candidatus Thiothrix sp. Deng01]|uniref:Uma2 family endonuclease n=1 Tax=Candidatus Thiothrix phosphatis TaxID=3112415 RepID=A0ABU6CXY7_9GAMM|nr:Uma2 family endonuclease [Candidatus Thiothrix sp. Deng01]MEB4590932.1 Uma2 family endonuclease [Candidatus Thiothrix sp. Deng01]
MPQTQQAPHITEAEYLEGEKSAKERHEYLDGKVYLMAGASKRHNKITLNVVRSLPLQNRDGTPCDIYSADIKVRVKQGRAYYYPDVLVSCAPDNTDEYYLESPCLVVEVTSKSTEWKDYNEKLVAYQSIPSLQHYLVVAQEKVSVTHFYREPDGSWWVNTCESLEDEISLVCPETNLTVQAIYQGVNFDGADA